MVRLISVTWVQAHHLLFNSSDAGWACKLMRNSSSSLVYNKEIDQTEVKKKKKAVNISKKMQNDNRSDAFLTLKKKKTKL